MLPRRETALGGLRMSGAAAAAEHPATGHDAGSTGYAGGQGTERPAEPGQVDTECAVKRDVAGPDRAQRERVSSFKSWSPTPS